MSFGSVLGADDEDDEDDPVDFPDEELRPVVPVVAVPVADTADIGPSVSAGRDGLRRGAAAMVPFVDDFGVDVEDVPPLVDLPPTAETEAPPLLPPPPPEEGGALTLSDVRLLALLRPVPELAEAGPAKFSASLNK